MYDSYFNAETLPDKHFHLAGNQYSDRRGGRREAGMGNDFVCQCLWVGYVRMPFPNGIMSMQESVKARHPQLLYESKLYKILQGGGE